MLLQGEGEAEDGGQRRPELVRDGGEDVLAQPLDLALLGDVLRGAEHRAGLASSMTTRPRPSTIRSSPSDRRTRCSKANGLPSARPPHRLRCELAVVRVDELR